MPPGWGEQAHRAQGQHDEHHGNRKRSLHTPARGPGQRHERSQHAEPDAIGEARCPHTDFVHGRSRNDQAARPQCRRIAQKARQVGRCFLVPAEEWPAGKDTASEDPPAADRRPIDRQTGLGTPHSTPNVR